MAKNLNNLTVITKISSSKSLTSSINYTNSDKPHNSDHGRIKHRDLKSWGINCSDDPQLARLQMTKTLWEAHAHRVHDVREIKSFNDVLDYRNPHDRKIAIKLNTAMMKAEHPNCQIFCQLQADGKTHHIHIHNHVCPRQFTDLKSITANQMSIRYYIKPIDDKIMKAHHFSTLRYHQSKSYRQRISNGERYYSNHGGSWVEAIRNKLNYARLHATNSKNYIKLVQNQGINIECFKMHKVNGKRQLHIYNNYSKSPKVKELQEPIESGKYKGKYIRLRSHFSYDFHYHGKKYKIRDKKLGSDFFVLNLLNQFKSNRQQKLHPNTKINQPASLNHPVKHSVKHLKSLAHQQSDGIQPVLNRAKNNVSGKKDINSIEHKPKNTSVVRANKLLHNPKYFHLHGSLTVHPHVQTIHSTLNDGTQINIPHHVPKHTFHLAMIKLPHMPHFVPLVAYLGTKGNNDTKQAIVANLNQDIIDKNERTYNDYLDNVATVKDLSSNRRAQNKDVAMSDRDRSREIIKERIDEARSMHI